MKVFPVAALIISVCFTAHAGDPYSEIISSIVESNPDISSQHNLALAEAAAMADDNALPNPEVSMGRVWGKNGVGNKFQFDISQSFSWPGLYAARRKAGQKALGAAEMLVESGRLSLAAEVRTLLLELVYVRKQADLQKRMIASMEKLGESIDISLAKGEITALDQKKQRIELYKMETTLSALETREAQIEASVRALGNGAQIDLAQITEYPLLEERTAEDYRREFVENNPVYASGSLVIEQESLKAKAANLARIPSLTLGFQHQAEMGDRFNGFTIGMTLPFFEGRHARKAALYRKQAAEDSRRMLAASRYAEIDGLIDEARLWKKQMDAYDDVLGDNAYMDMLNKVYKSGEISMLDYIGEMQYLSEASFSYLEAQHGYCQALASLAKYQR